MATWITDAVLTNAVKAVLGYDPALALPTFWKELIVTGNLEGFNHVRRTLVARDFSAASLDTWIEREQWNRTAGLYYTLSAADLDDNKITGTLDKLWARLELLNSLVLLDSAGAVINPGELGGGAGPNIGYGADVADCSSRNHLDNLLDDPL